MEAPPIEKAIKKVEKEDKEQKLESQVEEVLGRKSVKKPGRLSRFLGEVVPGYEKSVGVIFNSCVFNYRIRLHA